MLFIKTYRWALLTIAALIALAFVINSQMATTRHELVNTAVVSAKKDVVIDTQASALVSNEVVRGTNEVMNKEAEADNRKIAKTFTEIRDRVDAKTRAVETDMYSKPITPESRADAEEQLSRIRIDGLWEAFCAVNEDPKCAAYSGAKQHD